MKKKITIEIDNVTEAEARAIEHFMAVWQKCGEEGMSRMTAFYADGDGAFRPKITVDGNAPRLEDAYINGSGDKYYAYEPITVDFDKIWSKYNT